MLEWRVVRGFQNRTRDKARFGEEGRNAELGAGFSEASTGACGLGGENPGGDVRRWAIGAVGGVW